VARPGNLVVGLLALLLASVQALAAAGRIEVSQWPFVRNPNRTVRCAAAAWGAFIGVVLIVSAFWWP
jgi:hypothetical protein